MLGLFSCVQFFFYQLGALIFVPNNDNKSVIVCACICMIERETETEHRQRQGDRD